MLGLQKKLSMVLKPFSYAYGAMMTSRAASYENNGFKCSCLCVSVGNIAWGGTGKTPLVDWLLTWLEAHSINTVVLSRGYKSSLKKFPTRVNSRHTAREVGDEPAMLANSHPRSSILIDPDRARSARLACDKLDPKCIILDDGFQHLRLSRDLDIVLLRPEDLSEDWNKIIPAGPWREPEKALHRADIFMIKAMPEKAHSLLPAITSRLTKYGKPVFTFSLEPKCLRRIGENRTVLPEDCNEKPYVLLTGVGEPRQVFNTVTKFMGYPPQEHIVRPDHHIYRFNEVERLARRNVMIVSTAKDAVKLRHLPAPNFWFLETELKFGPSFFADTDFPTWWNEWYSSNRFDGFSS